MPDLNLPTAAIILAAGGSTRMGTPKQLLRWKGETLIRRAVSVATEAGCDLVIVVVGCRHEEMISELQGTSALTIVNEDWNKGIGTSIRAGVAALMDQSPDARAAVLMLSDQVHVTAATIRELVATFDASTKPVAVSQYENTLGPPIAVEASMFPEFLKLRDEQGAKALWMRRPEIVEVFPCEPGGADVDTPEDFERLCPR